MDDLTSSLADVEQGLRSLQRHVLLERLQPGLTAERSRSLLGQAGLPTSGQVEALYGWRDGTQTAGVGELGDIHFFPGFCLLSMEDAVADYRSFVLDRRWMPGGLPVFANGGGDFYVTDLSGPTPGVVRHFRIEESEHPIEFLTIRDMLVTIAAGFERGVFFLDGSGYLEMDDLAYAALAAELNPRVSWWVG